jgi:hypothetical protein
MLIVAPDADAVMAEFPVFSAVANAVAREEAVLPCP